MESFPTRLSKKRFIIKTQLKNILKLNYPKSPEHNNLISPHSILTMEPLNNWIETSEIFRIRSGGISNMFLCRISQIVLQTILKFAARGRVMVLRAKRRGRALGLANGTIFCFMYIIFSFIMFSIIFIWN